MALSPAIVGNTKNTNPPSMNEWNWGDPITLGFNWQNPRTYVQFMNAIWERVLATGIPIGDFISGGISPIYNQIKPRAVQDLTPTLYWKVGDPTSKPKAVNVQSVSCMIPYPTFDFETNEYLPSMSYGSDGNYGVIGLGSEGFDRNLKSGFNYKGIGELELAMNDLIYANFLNPANIDLHKNTVVLGCHIGGLGNDFDRNIFLKNIALYQNSDDPNAYPSAKSIAKLIGQNSYPRRRRPREIFGPAGNADITDEHGQSDNDTLAPVGAIAYKIVEVHPLAVGQHTIAQTRNQIVDGFYKHIGGGTWIKLFKTNGVAADLMDSEYPVDHPNFIVPHFLSGTLSFISFPNELDVPAGYTGAYIDWTKFDEIYKLCKLMKYTGSSGQLFRNPNSQKQPVTRGGSYGYTAFDSSTLQPAVSFGILQDFEIPIGGPQALDVQAAPPLPFPTLEVIAQTKLSALGHSGLDINCQWVQGYPIWSGLKSETTFWVYVRPLDREPSNYDDQELGLVSDSWNVWDTKVNQANAGNNYTFIYSKQYNPTNTHPSPRFINETEPPLEYAGLAFTNWFVTHEWHFKYA